MVGGNLVVSQNKCLLKNALAVSCVEIQGARPPLPPSVDAHDEIYLKFIIIFKQTIVCGKNKIVFCPPSALAALHALNSALFRDHQFHS